MADEDDVLPEYVDSSLVNASSALRYRSLGLSTLADGCRLAGTGGGVFRGSRRSPAHTFSQFTAVGLKSRSPILRGSRRPLNSVRSCEKSMPRSSRRISALWNERWKLLVYSQLGAPSYSSVITRAASCICFAPRRVRPYVVSYLNEGLERKMPRVSRLDSPWRTRK